MNLTRRSFLAHAAAAAASLSTASAMPAPGASTPSGGNGNEVGHVLLIVDMQNDYFPGGAMELVGSDEASIQAANLLTAFRNNGLPVIHVQHISKSPGATFFVPDTAGVEIHESVRPGGDEVIIVKNYPNSFRETGLLAHLQILRFDTLVIAGMMTHMCIDTTVRAASDLGFACLLAHDACATLDLEFDGIKVPADHVHASHLAALDGSFARVLPAGEIVRQLKPGNSFQPGVRFGGTGPDAGSAQPSGAMVNLA